MCSSFNVFIFASLQPTFVITWQSWCICVCAHVFNDKVIYFPMLFGMMLVPDQEGKKPNRIKPPSLWSQGPPPLLQPNTIEANYANSIV